MVKQKPVRFSWRGFFERRIRLLAILSVFLLIFGQLGSLHWFFELFSHFLPYYTLVFILATLLCGKPWRYLFSALSALSLLWLLLPFGMSNQAISANRLLWYNVNISNSKAELETARIMALNADFVALAEINIDDEGWKTLRQHYPYGCQHKEFSPFALAVWAKQPLSACDVRMISGIPYIRAQHGDTVIFAVHPPPPVNTTLAAIRQQYLAITAADIARENKVLVVGDLNTTPFSPLYRQFKHNSKTQSQTPAWLPTWRPFYINIDHVFIRDNVVDVQPQPWLGSDHRPLLVNWQ